MPKTESINALEKFIQNIYWTESMSTKESTKNIENSIIEIIHTKNNIIYIKQSKGVGILITENGYLLTANHVIKKNNGKIIHNKHKYKIEKICQQNIDEDIVLVKANIPKEAISLEYKIANLSLLKNNYSSDFPVNLKTSWDNKIENRYGFLKITTGNSYLPNNEISKNQMIAQIQAIPGDSGSPLFNTQGELMGLITSTNNHSSSFTKIFTGLDLIQKEIEHLKKEKAPNKWF